jgi:hypothetical protein
MTNQNFIKVANRVIKDKVFQYKGPLIFDIPLEVTIEFKLKIVGDLTLISAGEPKNYISLDVTVVNISPKYFSSLIKTIENNQYEIGKNMWFFKIMICLVYFFMPNANKNIPCLSPIPAYFINTLA